MEDQIWSQNQEDGALLHLLSALQLELRVTVPAHLRKAAHPSHWFWVRLDPLFCWSFGHRKPRMNCHSPTCESAAPVKCVYKLLVYKCVKKNLCFLLPKVVIYDFNGQGLMFVFYVSLKHNFGIIYSFKFRGRFYYNRSLMRSTWYRQVNICLIQIFCFKQSPLDCKFNLAWNVSVKLLLGLSGTQMLICGI